MPTIDQVAKNGSTDANGNADYSVKVLPDNLQPGRGRVFDQHGHSEDWESFNGDPVTVGIIGRPPFRASQVHEVLSGWKGLV